MKEILVFSIHDARIKNNTSQKVDLSLYMQHNKCDGKFNGTENITPANQKLRVSLLLCYQTIIRLVLTIISFILFEILKIISLIGQLSN